MGSDENDREAPSHTTPSEQRDLMRWQRKLLPFMTRFIVVLAVVFFALSLYDDAQMRAFVTTETDSSVRA